MKLSAASSFYDYGLDLEAMATPQVHFESTNNLFICMHYW